MTDDVTYSVLVNGSAHRVRTPPDKTLLMVLRDDLGLTGTKFNCEQGECGACTVLFNGLAVNSCLVLGIAAEGHDVQTVEGLADSDELDVVQQSFVECDAAQCGYCTPGMVLSTRALLTARASPVRADIEEALAGNYCRCTGYDAIVRAVELAASRGLNR